MSVFIQPPFWARGGQPPYVHAVSSVVDAPTEEPLTLQQAKDRAGLSWADGDAREDMLRGFIAAARSKVEQRTGLALLTQTRDVLYDRLPVDRAGTFKLPAQSMPLQSVTSVKYTNTGAVLQTVDPATYLVDLTTARIGLVTGNVWPVDPRVFQPWVVRIVSGWLDAATFRAAAPMLFHAVGLLTAHYATLGRDLASLDSVVEMPFGFEDAIEEYTAVTVP